MNNDINKLLTTYQVLNEIMQENHLTKDTSFNRVKNIISNMICDKLEIEKINNI